jgi:hypothetical protein
MSKRDSWSQERSASAGVDGPRPPFPEESWLQSPAEERRFELLRLAAFALRLRSLEEEARRTPLRRQDQERLAWRRRLLQHAIFQQVVALRRLDGLAAALAVLRACRL